MNSRGAVNILYGLVAFLLAGAVVLGVWFSSGCKGKPEWNILLLTLDTTRADRVRCYGYVNVETPALNSMAREGLLFERAYSHIPLTLPAHISIHTGTHPNFHGVRDNGAYRLRDEIVTLAEALKDHGYSTAAFISAAVLRRIFHIDQGFDHWDEEDIEPQFEDSPLVAERKGDRTTDAMLSWLEGHREEKWFVWLHYYDPHQSFDPPGSYSDLYAQDPYAGEIAFMDSQIGRVFTKLDEWGLSGRTLVIAIGDHGEGLNEHDESTHAMLIYETTQHVPLLMRIPGLQSPGRRISSPVSQVDVMPTVLDLLSFPSPEGIQGKSMKPLILEKENEFDSRAIYLESRYLLLHFGWAEQIGLVTPRYKFIRTPKPEIYDLTNDPHELFNIADANPKLLKELKFRLKELEEQYRYAGLDDLPADEIELDEKTRKQLLALGYMPGRIQIDEEKANRKDPKDYKHLIPLFMNANQAFFRSDFQGLLTVTDRILQDDPDHISAIRLKGEAFFGLGKYEEALDWHRKAIELLGEHHGAYAEAGNILIRLDRLEEAKEYLEKALELRKGDFFSLYYLGRIHLSLGDMEKGYEIFQSERMRDHALGHLGMAKYYENMGRPGRAEAEYEKSLELNDKLASIYVEYASMLYPRGEYQKAYELLQKALELDATQKFDPKFADYYERLKKWKQENPEPALELNPE